MDVEFFSGLASDIFGELGKAISMAAKNAFWGWLTINRLLIVYEFFEKCGMIVQSNRCH